MRFYNYLNEDKKTDYLETAQCLGAVISSSTMNKINKFFETSDGKDDISKELISTFNKKYDWNVRGKDEVIKALSNNNKFVEVLSLVRGMNNYVQSIVSSKISTIYFVHDKIDDYYKLEKKIFGEIKGAKANTADCVICNVPLNKLFKSMKTSTYEIDESGGFIKFEDGTIYFQVSLKKSKEGAQLGKVTKKLKNMGYDISAISGLDEGKILDKIKNVSKSIWKKVSLKISSILSSLKKRIMKKFKSGMSKKDLTELSQLSEAKISNNTMSIANSILDNPNNILNRINTYITKIMSQNSENVYINVDILSTVKKSNDINLAFKLASNLKTVKLINEFLNDVDKIGQSIKPLIADMLFGGTNLPLWKVYGDYGSGVSYEYLGTIETFVSQSTPIGVEVFGVNIKKSKGGWYTITLFMLETVDSEGKHYVMFRTGTNSSSRFTFIVEGTKVIVVPMEKNIDNILK